MASVMSIDENGALTSGKNSGKSLDYLLKKDAGYLFYLWLHGHGDDSVKARIAELLPKVYATGRTEYIGGLLVKTKEAQKEVRKAQQTISYLESFIEFCSDCGNPKDDCICDADLGEVYNETF